MNAETDKLTVAGSTGRVVIDRQSRTITSPRGLLGFLRKRSTPVDEVRTVTISLESRTSYWRREGMNEYMVFAVRIAGKGKPIVVDEPPEFDQARARAEEVARFLGVGVVDTTSGEKVTREAGTLDESLRDRLRRTGRKLKMPNTPPGAKAKVTVTGDEATFDLPPAPLEAFLSAGVWILIVTVLGVAICVIVNLTGAESDLWGTEGIPTSLIVGGGVVGLVLGLFVLRSDLRSAAAHQFVTVNPRTLRSEISSSDAAMSGEIPTDELEELLLGGSVITARSDRATIEIGKGLDEQELKWLKEVIEFIVTSPERAR